jgi:hypothetical protein
MRPGLISHQLLAQLGLLSRPLFLAGIKKFAQKLVTLLLCEVAVNCLGVDEDATEKPLLGGAGGTGEEPGLRVEGLGLRVEGLGFVG